MQPPDPVVPASAVVTSAIARDELRTATADPIGRTVDAAPTVARRHTPYPPELDW